MTEIEAELEQLRILLRRGQGIGTPSDIWTQYTGRDEVDIIRSQVADYMESLDAPEGEAAEEPGQIGDSEEAAVDPSPASKRLAEVPVVV